MIVKKRLVWIVSKMANITNNEKVLRGGLELWFTAALGDRDTMFELLAEHGDFLDVDFRHSANTSTYLKGTTPLHIAAHNGHLNMVRYLKSCGADINAQSESGFTALHFAIVKGHIKCVKILLELGADRTIVDENGWSPLDLARKWEREEIIPLLETETETV